MNPQAHQPTMTRCGACGREYNQSLTKACPMCAGTGQQLLSVDPEPPKPTRGGERFATTFIDRGKKARPK